MQLRKHLLKKKILWHEWMTRQEAVAQTSTTSSTCSLLICKTVPGTNKKVQSHSIPPQMQSSPDVILLFTQKLNVNWNRMQPVHVDPNLLVSNVFWLWASGSDAGLVSVQLVQNKGQDGCCQCESNPQPLQSVSVQTIRSSQDGKLGRCCSISSGSVHHMFLWTQTD